MKAILSVGLAAALGLVGCKNSCNCGGGGATPVGHANQAPAVQGTSALAGRAIQNPQTTGPQMASPQQTMPRQLTPQNGLMMPTSVGAQPAASESMVR